ncbi:MAG: hypothetical protein R2752_06250, partial [Vicinamibacterales bacterium]
IDPFDLSKDLGRSDGDQRHQLVVTGAVRTPAGPATTAWASLTHGFEFSSTLQAYSAPPLNVVTGTTTVQGTAARPMVDGRFIDRNAGAGDPFVSVSVRVQRAFRLGGHARLEGLVEVFNLFNRTNVLARNATFGTGTYPTAPSASFRQITAVGDPRTVQVGVRVRF